MNAGRWQVSVAGGRAPKWASSGRELFFQGPGREMMVVDVETTPVVRADAPRTLFAPDPRWASGDIVGTYYSVAPDDQRFLVATRADAAQDGDEVRPRSVLVNNFIEELKAKVPR